MQKLALLLSIIILTAGVSLGQTSGFTYQGKLADGGSPANGSYQFECKLFDADTGGFQVGPTQTVVATVQNGIFTTRLDFGEVPFVLGQDLWLEISVRLNGSPDPYAVLTPRQQVDSVPFAVHSFRATTADDATHLRGFPPEAFVPFNDLRLSDARSPLPGSPNYIQNTIGQSAGSQQLGNFNISGNGKVGGTLTAGSFIGGNFTGDGSGLNNVPGTFLWHLVAALSQQAQPNTGYVITSPGQTTVTLPSSANIGDVVRVSSTAAAGWKIAQIPGQSILLANLGSAGKDWTAYETNRNWTAIASSADGSKLVAAVRNGQIYSSADSGVTWVARNVGIKQWGSVASSADGTKLVAVANASQGGPNGLSPIYVSTDSGATWTPRENPRDWSAVASSSDGTKLVAVGNGERIYTSTNSGVTWTPHDSNRTWQAVASSADGTKLVAATGGNGRIYVSADSGANWTPQGITNNWQSIASSADGSKLIAAAFNGSNGAPTLLYTSTDSGMTWVIREQGKDWISVASSADGGKLLAAVSNGQLYTSSDSGVTWVPHETSRNWSAVASSADATRLIAVVLGGQIYTSSGSSSSTTTIGSGNLIGSPSAAIELQFVGNGLWIPLSHEGAIVGH